MLKVLSNIVEIHLHALTEESFFRFVLSLFYNLQESRNVSWSFFEFCSADFLNLIFGIEDDLGCQKEKHLSVDIVQLRCAKEFTDSRDISKKWNFLFVVILGFPSQ